MEVFSSMMRRAISGGYLSGWKVEGVLGLRINLEKSEMIPLFGNAPWGNFQLFGGVGWVEERFRRRLAMWKRQYISKGGRLTLIRSTMSSMPIYLMSLVHLPRKVRLRLEKIQRDFLWGGGTLAHKPHLVRWNLVCLEKRKRWTRGEKFILMNNTLLCKWNWRFANERDALWRSVISLKYGVEEGAGVLGM
ncbi:putative ribonuclease H protein [Vitis vinifera]|uniref:Putative ribonuclease H protein n=1 Tax=Vitis vinifera TaxID=29760 RepID=A0A438F388_VITVI|nr:putative ribonuclease H protein [Vitis vinifera]